MKSTIINPGKQLRKEPLVTHFSDHSLEDLVTTRLKRTLHDKLDKLLVSDPDQECFELLIVLERELCLDFNHE